MKIIQICYLLLTILICSSCASSYKPVEPETLKYVSRNVVENVTLEYKYNLLKKKYEKKQKKNGIQLVAVKITNNSEQDYMFGRDITLAYTDGSEAIILENDVVFKELKQKGAYHLFYLLLSPMQLYTTDSNGNQSSSTPIGLVVGPGIAGTNMLIAGSANKKFQNDLMEYDLNGMLIKKGETKYGIVGLSQDTFESLELKVK